MIFGIAFSDSLWGSIRAAVRRRLERRIRNTHDAEDLTQDSLLVAYQKSDRIEDEQSLEIYTHKISRLQLANYARRRKNAAQRAGTKAVESVAEAGIPPEDSYAYHELMAILMDFATTLPPKEKALLKLLVRDASGEEICQALQITPQARNLLAFRLRRKLRQTLSAKGYLQNDPPAKKDRIKTSDEKVESYD